MEKEEYRSLYALEDRLWWFVGMRAVSLALIDRFVDRSSARSVLDVGCGTGGMMIRLRRVGPVIGVDLSEQALSFAKRREPGRLVRADLLHLPFPSGSFDLLTSFDVIYHQSVGNDDAALSEMARLLRPGGRLVLRVPAHDWLRGRHDAAVHTRHRYAKRELGEKLQRAGLEPKFLSYANCFLFPLAVSVRFAERFFDSGGRGSDVRDVPSPINWLLTALLKLEAAILGRYSLPFGLSLVAVARRPCPE